MEVSIDVFRLYYAQIVRPLDSWALINRAAVTILVILKRYSSACSMLTLRLTLVVRIL